MQATYTDWYLNTGRYQYTRFASTSFSLIYAGNNTQLSDTHWWKYFHVSACGVGDLGPLDDRCVMLTTPMLIAMKYDKWKMSTLVQNVIYTAVT